jgi:hypothetical protein
MIASNNSSSYLSYCIWLTYTPPVVEVLNYFAKEFLFFHWPVGDFLPGNTGRNFHRFFYLFHTSFNLKRSQRTDYFLHKIYCIFLKICMCDVQVLSYNSNAPVTFSSGHVSISAAKALMEGGMYSIGEGWAGLGPGHTCSMGK